MKDFWTRVGNRLLTVKSIVTIALTAVFAVLSITGAIAPVEFTKIFYIVIAFYFGSSLEKTARANNTTTE